MGRLESVRCAHARTHPPGKESALGSLLGQGGQPRDISQKTSWGTPSVIYLLNALDERSSFLGCPTPKSLIWFLPTRRGTAPFINP